MSSVIFFDLETTDKEFCGQLLNYCFLSTDSNFITHELLQGNVALSRLQIPSPGALLANRVRLSQHQGDTEQQALVKIGRFIQQCIENNGGNPVVLAGYNSARFDVPYLRTCFIRNGLNPYFGGKIIYRDVYHSVRFLALTNEAFRSELAKHSEGRPSLKLEVVTKALGLLEGKQTHESKDDVLLLQKLCIALDREYKHDVSRFNPYHAKVAPAAAIDSKHVVTAIDIYRGDDEAAPFAFQKKVVLFRDSPKQALWLHLADFREGKRREALSYYTKGSGYFFVESCCAPTDEELQLISEAARELGSVTLENYFERSTCDIELDIFRLSFKGIEALGAAIWEGNVSVLKQLNERDANVLFARYKLATGEFSEKLLEGLKQYAQYRYGGRMQISKSNTGETVRYFPSLASIEQELIDCKASRLDEESQLILRDLEQYISQSPMKQFF